MKCYAIASHQHIHYTVSALLSLEQCQFFFAFQTEECFCFCSHRSCDTKFPDILVGPELANCCRVLHGQIDSDSCSDIMPMQKFTRTLTEVTAHVGLLLMSPLHLPLILSLSLYICLPPHGAAWLSEGKSTLWPRHWLKEDKSYFQWEPCCFVR